VSNKYISLSALKTRH